MIPIFLFFSLMILGVPIAFVLGMTTVGFVFLSENINVMESMPSRMFNGLQNFGLVAIPMFIFLGEVMNKGGITKRLIDFSQVILGHLKGGLGYVNVVANMFLASIIGSANAQSAVMSKVMVPAMEKEGYRKDFSAALTSASSVMGPLIPPSMPFIIFGVTASTSIGKLFLAGIAPGILLTIAYGVAIYFIAKKEDLPTSEKSTVKEVSISFVHVLPALVIPLFIVIGITTGFFTATESGAMAAFVAVLVGMFIYKDLKMKHMYEIIYRTVITTSTVTFLLATSNIFGWVLSFQQIPQLIADVFLSIASNQYMFLILATILLLIVGMFLEGIAALILLVPILLPVAVQFGVDPVHFGVIMVLNLTIGLLTPPVGTVLFIVSSITKVKIGDLVKSMMPFLIIAFIVLLLVTFIPAISLFIPSLFKL